MSEKFKTEAFVLRAVNYGERDVIVTLYSRERGLLSALAKNARSSKRFAGGIQLFRKVDAMLDRKAGREVDLFLEMNVLAHYPNIESSYDKITIGSYGSELLRELSKGDEDSERLFDLLGAFYRELDELGDDARTVETILHHFELRLLGRFGALPLLHTCHRCGKSHADMEKLLFKRTGEGLLCVDCRRPGEAVGVVEVDTLSALHYYMEPAGSMPEALLMPDVRQQSRRVVNNSFRLILQRDLKSRAMLEAVLA